MAQRRSSFGTARPQRAPSALHGDALLLDSRTPSQWLAMAPSIAAELRYYDTNLREVADMRRFFAADPQILVAAIAEYPVGALRRKLDAGLALALRAGSADHGAAVEGHAYLTSTVDEAWSLLNDWATALEEVDHVESLRHQLQATIRERLAPLSSVLTRLASDGAATAAQTPNSGDDLENLAHGTIDALTSIVDGARAALAASSWEFGRAPQVALYIAFIRQLSKFYGAYNGLVARHHRFYLTQVLQMQPRPAQAVRSWVVFGLKPGTSAANLPAGTRVVDAPDPSGKSRVFSLSEALQVLPVTVAHVRTVSVASTSTGKVRMSATEPKLVAPALLTGAEPAWPTLGAVSAEATRQPGAPDGSRLGGFALGAASLMGLDGDRTLTITLRLGAAGVPGDAWKFFNAQVSTQKGWAEASVQSASVGQAQSDLGAKDPEPGSPRAAPSIVLQLGLPQSVEPLAPPKPSAGAHHDWPQDRPWIWLSPKSSEDAELPDWLVKAVLQSASIEVEVSESTAGQVIGPNGRVAGAQLTALWAPWGGAPDVGARIEISHPVAFALPLTRFELHLEWDNIPSAVPQGFAVYYAGYLASTASAPGTPGTPHPAPPVSLSGIWGIDVSDNQGTIDWTRVASAGCRLAYIKISEGATYPDKADAQKWVHDAWQGAGAAGIPRGAYHYWRSEDSSNQQVDNFARQYDLLQHDSGDLPPALDLEDLGSASTLEHTIQEATRWLEAVHDKSQRRPILYLDLSCWIRSTNPFPGYELWLANGQVSGDGAIGRLPGWGKATFYQKTFENGPAWFGGKPVDLDWFVGDDAAWRRWVSGSAPEVGSGTTQPVVELAAAPLVESDPAPAANIVDGFDDRAFQVTTACELPAGSSPGSFVGQPECALFVPASSRSVPRSSSIATPASIPASRALAWDVSAWKPGATRAVSVELSAPSRGFGSGLYAAAVSRIALQNAQVLLTAHGTVAIEPPRATVAVRPQVVPGATRAAVEAAVVETLAKGVETEFGPELGKGVERAVAGAVPSVAPVLELPPNPPFTPKTRSISFTFSAKLELLADSFRVVQPADASSPVIVSEAPQSGAPLLAGGTQESAMYLRLAGAKPGELISLLWVVAGPTAAPADSLLWEVWSDYVDEQKQPQSGWRKLGFVSDLSETGVVRFELPVETALATPYGPTGEVCLRVSGSAPGGLGSKTVAIYPNAALVVREPEGESKVSAGVPVPAGTLLRLSPTVSAIASVSQPLPSFGGMTAESSEDFAVRVSERLRHKQRALTAWDYERLALAEEDSIFAAHCLPAARMVESGEVENAAGHVLVVVVPRVRPGDVLREDDLPPRIPPSALERLQRSLSKVAALRARVEVREAIYVQLPIRCQLSIKKDCRAQTVVARVTQALQRSASGWLFDPEHARSVPRVVDVRMLREAVVACPGVQQVNQLQLDFGSKGPPAWNGVRVPFVGLNPLVEIVT